MPAQHQLHGAVFVAYALDPAGHQRAGREFDCCRRLARAVNV